VSVTTPENSFIRAHARRSNPPAGAVLSWAWGFVINRGAGVRRATSLDPMLRVQRIGFGVSSRGVWWCRRKAYTIVP
jgi:hypothetical protein